MKRSEHQEVPLRYLSEVPINNGLGEAAADGDSDWPRYIRITDFKSLFMLDPSKHETLPPEVAARAQVSRGDLLMAAVGATVGVAYLHTSDEPACYAGYLVRFRPNLRKVLPHFAAYWTNSSHYWGQIHAGSVGSTIENFSASKYRAMTMPVPCLEIQEQVVRFLRVQTAKIDALIGKQEQLIETLAERRLALVLRSVLQRQDTTLRGNLGRFFLRRVRPATPELGVVTAFRDGQVTARASRREQGFTFSDQEGGYQAVYRGDLVFHGLDGFSGAVGVSESDGKCSPVYHVMKTHPGIDPRYAAHYLRSLGTSGFLEAYAWSVRQRSVDYRNWSVFAKLPLEFPPLGTQIEVVEHLDRETSQIDALSAKAREMIDVLKERRQALISAAVTGKIDVRTTEAQ